ncbi:MAG: alpha-galactosidase [Candidatus Fimimorpha sp.]
MAIFFNENKKVFTMSTNHSSYQMQVNPLGILLHVYYGSKICEQDEMGYLISYRDRGFSGNPYDALTDRTLSLDLLPQEYPTYGVGDYRVPTIELVHADGSYAADFRYESYCIKKGKYQVDGMPALYAAEDEAETLIITLKEYASDVRLLLYYSVFEENDVITRAAKIVNDGESAIVLNRVLSACLDFQYEDFDLIHFHGRHCMERQMERVNLMHGIHRLSSARGASSHHHNPFFILCDKDATEHYGKCYGISLVYSGNFTAEIEVDQVNQTRAVIGIGDYQFHYNVKPKESFMMPEVVMSYSENGLQPLSHQYHKIYRHHLCRGKYQLTRRPILINNWEATYFDFNEEKLLHIAEQASELGIEMLVMDDGWFGKRDSDYSGLGDWIVNTKKLKGGLKPFVEKVNALGLKFGIWFEPEMVNEDSDLYRVHPEWVLQCPNRKPGRSRYQLVLDMGRKEVIDYLFDAICSILDSANIEYVKWDMNRSMSDVYSNILDKESQGQAYHRYMLGLYDLLERIVQRYPNLLLEGCSGGGGRFDPGMLYYSPQIWCSDDTDAIERLKIQYGTSFCYPISTVGAHVSAVPNHQTGRVVPYHTRGVVASAAGGFGYELDLSKVTEEERRLTKIQVENAKKYFDLVNNGTYYRLTNPFQNQTYTAWEFVSEDQSEALVSAVITKVYANGATLIVKPEGLQKDALYQIDGKEQVYSGAALMNGGICIPLPNVVDPNGAEMQSVNSGKEYGAVQYHIVKCSK